MSTHSERTRQMVHIAVGTIAFSLRFLDWGTAAACAAIATAFNAIVLPRFAGRTLLRPEEAQRAWRSGLVIYPLSVLALILAFPGSPDLAAAAWGVLAFGDGAATLVGRSRAGTWGRWPWNPAKSYAGSLAFLLSGALAGTVLMLWTAPALSDPRPAWMLWTAAPLAALIAALVESLAIRLDDNISVPASAALTLYWLSLIDASRLADAWPLLSQRVPVAVGVNVVVAALSWRLGAVSASGVWAGLAIGVLSWTFGGESAWALLFATFAVASAASKLGLRRKRLLGIEQERGGRRGAGNAIANCGVAVAAAVLVAGSRFPDAAGVAVVASLVAGASDTVASEIGKAWGRRTWSPVTFRLVPPGSSGGMSVEGTVAGILAAVVLAGLGALLGCMPSSAVPVVVATSFVAMVIEGALGAMLEPRGIVNNDVLNFLDTLIAAAMAVAVWTRYVA